MEKKTRALYVADTRRLLTDHPLVHEKYEVFQFPGRRLHESIWMRNAMNRVLCQVFPEQFTPPDNTHDLTRILDSPEIDSAYIVGDSKSRDYCGCAMLRLWPYPYVHWLGVSQKYRRQGVASTLIAKLAARVQQLGYKNLWAYSTTATKGVRAFYERSGFMKVSG